MDKATQHNTAFYLVSYKTNWKVKTAKWEYVDVSIYKFGTHFNLLF